jgi:hypothetical protein
VAFPGSEEMAEIDQAAMWQRYLLELQQRQWLEAMLARQQRDQSTMRTDTPDRAEHEPQQDPWNPRFYSQPQQARQVPDQQGARGLVPQQRFTGQRAPGEEPITRESMIASGRRELHGGRQSRSSREIGLWL